MVAWNHILLFLMSPWIVWALSSSSFGTCGTDQVTHVDALCWEAWNGLCFHDDFILASGASLRCLEHLRLTELSPSFSPDLSSSLTWTSLHGGWIPRELTEAARPLKYWRPQCHFHCILLVKTGQKASLDSRGKETDLTCMPVQSWAKSLGVIFSDSLPQALTM